MMIPLQLINRRAIAGFLLVMMALLAPAHATVDEEIAEALLKNNNDIVKKLRWLRKKERLTSHEALVLIQKIMSPIIDYDKLTQRAMGKYWRSTDTEVRDEITKNFRALLENTYAKVFAQYSGQTVQLVESSQLSNGDISVVLQVSGEGKSAEIDYLLSQKDEKSEFRITDIKVEGISLVANYRRQFSTIISRDGAEALVKKLNALAAAKIN